MLIGRQEVEVVGLPADMRTESGIKYTLSACGVETWLAVFVPTDSSLPVCATVTTSDARHLLLKPTVRVRGCHIQFHDPNQVESQPETAV